MFHRIVVGFDGSAQAHDALALALALARPQTDVVLCCVHPPQPRTARLAPAEHGALGHADAERRLELGRRAAGGRGRLRLRARSATSAAGGLHATAVEEEADLLVVGSSHRGALGRVLPGSTTEQALHAPPCAVAVAPSGLAPAGPVPLREIGVGFDGGREAREALRVALEVARDQGTRVRAVTVVEPAGRALSWIGTYAYPEYADDAREIAREDFDAALTELGAGADVSCDVVMGAPAEQLEIASRDLDLLVLGSRGYGPLRRVLLGAVAGRVAASAACPILVCPRAAEERAGEEAA